MLGLETLRQRRSSQPSVGTDREVILRELATIIADSGGLSADQVELYISADVTTRPVCPKVASHPHVKLYKTAGKVSHYVCNSCGHSWEQPTPPPRTDDLITLEELEDAVELVNQRRKWAAQHAEITARERRRDDLLAKCESANEAVDAAFKAREQASIDYKQALNAVVESQDAAFNLKRTALVSDEERELNARLRELQADEKSDGREAKKITKRLAEIDQQKLVP